LPANGRASRAKRGKQKSVPLCRTRSTCCVLTLGKDGNLVDTATLGTVEYGAAVLGSPLIVVLAHTSCGAVKAACDVVTKNATYPGAIGAMIEPILPAALAARGEPGDYVNNAAKLSAQRTAAKLASASTLISGLAGQGKLKIVSAIYDLQTGAVTVLG
jgi:carbonic anhydrase